MAGGRTTIGVFIIASLPPLTGLFAITFGNGRLNNYGQAVFLLFHHECRKIDNFAAIFL